MDFLAQAHRGGELRLPGTDGIDDGNDFDCLTTALRSHDWVVYTKPPFASAAHVLAYLGRYTHKVAIANHRLVDVDGEHVRFRWRDYADGNRRKIMRPHADEFVRRFLLHVLPRGFTRLRHYGLLANRGRDRKLALCRALIDQPAPPPREPETPQAMMRRLTGIDITQCRHCGREALRVHVLLPGLTTMRRRAWRPPGSSLSTDTPQIECGLRRVPGISLPTPREWPCHPIIRLPADSPEANGTGGGLPKLPRDMA